MRNNKVKKLTDWCKAVREDLERKDGKSLTIRQTFSTHLDPWLSKNEVKQLFLNALVKHSTITQKGDRVLIDYEAFNQFCLQFSLPLHLTSQEFTYELDFKANVDKEKSTLTLVKDDALSKSPTIKTMDEFMHRKINQMQSNVFQYWYTY